MQIQYEEEDGVKKMVPKLNRLLDHTLIWFSDYNDKEIKKSLDPNRLFDYEIARSGQ